MICMPLVIRSGMLARTEHNICQALLNKLLAITRHGSLPTFRVNPAVVLNVGKRLRTVALSTEYVHIELVTPIYYTKLNLNSLTF